MPLDTVNHINEIQKYKKYHMYIYDNIGTTKDNLNIYSQFEKKLGIKIVLTKNECIKFNPIDFLEHSRGINVDGCEHVITGGNGGISYEIY